MSENINIVHLEFVEIDSALDLPDDGQNARFGAGYDKLAAAPDIDQVLANAQLLSSFPNGGVLQVVVPGIDHASRKAHLESQK